MTLARMRPSWSSWHSVLKSTSGSECDMRLYARDTYIPSLPGTASQAIAESGIRRKKVKVHHSVQELQTGDSKRRCNKPRLSIQKATIWKPDNKYPTILLRQRQLGGRHGGRAGEVEQRRGRTCGAGRRFGWAVRAAQSTGDAPWNRTLGARMISLTNVTVTNLNK